MAVQRSEDRGRPVGVVEAVLKPEPAAAAAARASRGGARSLWHYVRS